MDREGWNRRYAKTELLWSARQNRFLEAEAASLPPGRALDIACGEGRNAVWLAQRGWRVVGVDFSDVGLTKAKRLANERGVHVEWVQADVREYMPAAGAYDLVVVLYLHLPADDRHRVLTRTASAVAPGGTLLVVGHDASNPAEGHGGPQDPAILFTPGEVAGELAGLTIERAERVRRAIATAGGDAQAIDALVRAKRRA